MDVLAVAIACLQIPGSAALLWGLEAAVRQAARDWSRAVLTCARFASGTLLLTQASYLAMYSSHSGMPSLSPLLPEVLVEEVVLVVVVVVVRFALPLFVVVVVFVVLEVFEESEPPHATSKSPKAAHSIRGMNVLFNN